MEKPLFVLFLLLFEIILSAQSNHSPFHLKFHEVEKHAIENMKDDNHRIEEWKKNQGKTFGEASNFEPESWMPAVNWSYSDAGKEQWQPLLRMALEERRKWGEYENGERCPFSLLTIPFFTDGEKKIENPLLRMSLKWLSRSRHFQEDKGLRRESVRNVIEICCNKDYNQHDRACLMHSFLFRELAREKWDAKLQSIFKREIIKGAVDGNEYLHHWLVFYWFLDWTNEEKEELLNALKPISRKFDKILAHTGVKETFESRERHVYEWLALLILCDNGDKDSLLKLTVLYSAMEFREFKLNSIKCMTAFLTLLRSDESVGILGKLMELKPTADDDIDDDDGPQFNIDAKDGLAHFAAQCLMMMVFDMPSAYDESLASEDIDFYSFPKGRRVEILQWLKTKPTFKFKPMENMLHYDNGMAYYIDTRIRLKFEDRDEDIDRYLHVMSRIDGYIWSLNH